MIDDASGKVSVTPLDPGLYLVATPIGHADDITLRALDILRRADVIAAEDTRRTRQLLDRHAIALNGRLMIPYHDHNGAAQRPKLLTRLEAGQAIALVSDAGTPLIADPGWRLAREAAAAGAAVTAAPGASAVLVALSLSGLPSDRFLFAGFAPSKAGERQRWLSDLATVSATLVLFEAPHRLVATLAAIGETLGNRDVAICRELTKRFEEVIRGSVDEVGAVLSARETVKGEIVIVIGPPAAKQIDDAALDTALREALERHSTRDAAHLVADATGVPRKRAYQRALALQRAGSDRSG
jgi:16S rRNA (cytidine1402-2'-O)-methyltransferase